MSIPRILSAALVVVLIAAVVLLYKFAPCSTFSGWSQPSFFFAVIWPLLVPAIIGWALLEAM
jgi:hypothetical protein